MPSFIEKLLLDEKYAKSISHPLTDELCKGTLPDYKLFTYLVEDLKFFQAGIRFIGRAVSLCDDPKAAIKLGKQLGFLCSNENDYFTKTLAELRSTSEIELQRHVPELLSVSPELLPAVREYIAALDSWTEGDSYVELITVLYGMEQVYLGWADRNLACGLPEALPYKFREWVDLHSGEDFENWVSFLKNEVERVVSEPSSEQTSITAFERMVELEILFFDACYNCGKK